MTLARLARPPRMGRRPRRHERALALLVELRFALRGKVADVHGMRTTLADVEPSAGTVELLFDVDDEVVQLGLPLAHARKVLGEDDPARVLFAMVAEIVAAEMAPEARPS